jgi:hypothetical protein
MEEIRRDAHVYRTGKGHRCSVKESKDIRDFVIVPLVM